jgi:hypothetical protein
LIQKDDPRLEERGTIHADPNVGNKSSSEKSKALLLMRAYGCEKLIVSSNVILSALHFLFVSVAAAVLVCSFIHSLFFSLLSVPIPILLSPHQRSAVILGW